MLDVTRFVARAYENWGLPHNNLWRNWWMLGEIGRAEFTRPDWPPDN